MVVILAVFVLVLILYYNNKRLAGIREKELLTKEYNEAILSAQLEIQEQTMKQISLEIHDNIGQILSLVNLNLKTLTHGDYKKLETTSALVNKAITDLRALSKSLNPDAISKAGLIQLIKNDLEQLQKTGYFTTSLEIKEAPEIPTTRLFILYRMIQEVLNNIIKHSEATEVKVEITREVISFADNGKGFDLAEASNGLGLINLQQRAKLINAEVILTSNIGKGTNVIFSINKIS